MSAMAMGGCDSLWSALAAVRDHRRGAGRRYPLAGLLLIAVAALLAGRRDQLGIVRWGRGLSVSVLASLGLTRGRVPAPSVWCELFQGLDVASLEAALGAWVRAECVDPVHAGSFGSPAGSGVQCGLAVFGEVFESFDGLAAGASDDGEHGVAQRGQNLWRRAGDGGAALQVMRRSGLGHSRQE